MSDSRRQTTRNRQLLRLDERSFDLLAFGHIRERQENQGCRIRLLHHVAPTEHEGFPADTRKIVYHFMIEEVSVVREYLFQQNSQVGFIPLSIPKAIHKPVQCSLWPNLESLIKRMICHQDMQVGVQ